MHRCVQFCTDLDASQWAENRETMARKGASCVALLWIEEGTTDETGNDESIGQLKRWHINVFQAQKQLPSNWNKNNNESTRIWRYKTNVLIEIALRQQSSDLLPNYFSIFVGGFFHNKTFLKHSNLKIDNPRHPASRNKSNWCKIRLSMKKVYRLIDSYQFSHHFVKS